MYQRRYTTDVVCKQPGYWRLELKPIKRQAPSRKRKEEPAPISLQQFIKSRGGIDPEYNHGQWAGEIRMVRDSGKRGVTPGVFNARAMLTLEELTQECQEAGYIADPDIDSLLGALAIDIAATIDGDRSRRVYGHSGVDYLTATGYARWESLLPEEDAA